MKDVRGYRQRMTETANRIPRGDKQPDWAAAQESVRLGGPQAALVGEASMGRAPAQSINWSAFLADPLRRKQHAIIIIVAIVIQLVLSYATYLPGVHDSLTGMSYLRVYTLHEMGFLLIVAYTALVFHLAGGLAVLAVAAVSSTPFVFTQYNSGSQPWGIMVVDLPVLTAFALMMGVLIVLLCELVTRSREVRRKAEELRLMNQRIEMVNRQLSGLNQLMQTRLNRLFDDLHEAVEEEQGKLDPLPPSPVKEEFFQFLEKMSYSIKAG